MDEVSAERPVCVGRAQAIELYEPKHQPEEVSALAFQSSDA